MRTVSTASPTAAIAPMASSGCHGQAELADDEHVQRRAQRGRDLGRDDDTAAGEAENESGAGALADVRAQRLGQRATGVAAVGEAA